MIALKRAFGSTLFMTALLVMIAGCDRQEGPAEQAGKGVDQAMHTAGEKIESAGESIQDTASGEQR